ncbi:MAG: dipeptide epimerase [Bryobacterales bacterium]|nr:dipeptide epimerase [Bryobacterales bacterium]
MLRRAFLAAPAPAALPALAASAAVLAKPMRLTLRHTWTTTMSSSTHRDTILFRFTHAGIEGHGEGAPIVRYHESAGSGCAALNAKLDSGFFRRFPPEQFDKTLREVNRLIPGEWAAKAAVAAAVLDWNGKRLGVPVYRLFGLDPSEGPVTTFSIGIDTPEMTRQKVREAAAYPELKIKVGLDSDEATIAAVRAETSKPLRVDANEGWKTKEQAVEKINWLERQGVVSIEQPLPAARLDEMNWIRRRVHIPVIADEACLHAADIPKLAPHFDGVNIKLDKCGGILEAYRMIQTARSLGLKVMVGCMVSSSLAITAAAHLSPLLDFADLDGNLLLSHDPFRGVRVERGRLRLPSGPGLGVTAA